MIADSSASLGGLASHDVDGGPNTLILLSVGEAQPMPLPPNTTFPPNILQLDVLQLEFALLQQAQRQGVPGVGERHHPLQSLRQLLHHLQIPVTQHAPLGNAGNEAFYTVLAFQKLLMRETRLPDQLFAQPAYIQPGYAPQADYFVPPPVAPFAPSMYSPYGGLPMPPPIGRESRRGSATSINRMSMPADLEPPVLPNPLTRQGTGDSGYGASSKRATTMAVSTSHQDMRPSARDDVSPSSTTRSGTRAPLPRSQTVYWDDAEYSNGPAGAEGRTSTSRTRQNGKTSAPPPSSLRHSQVINGNGLMPNSRSVSFHEAGRPPTIRSQGSSSGKESIAASRSNSGTALGPSHLSMANGTSGNGNPNANSGSGSASSGDSSGKGDANDTVKPKVRKQKSSHSVKHLSSAFSKFWVD